VRIAEAVTAFYYQPRKRRRDGKLKIHMNPATSVETYQTCVNPSPDLATLISILPRLLALSQDLATAKMASYGERCCRIFRHRAWHN
jgi:hypothetical protein